MGPGGALEVAVADITQPATLLPEMFTGVRAAVLASAVKVQPKEGDNEQRDKYMQVRNSPCLESCKQVASCVILFSFAFQASFLRLQKTRMGHRLTQHTLRHRPAQMD